jgi:hypothetical protein
MASPSGQNHVYQIFRRFPVHALGMVRVPPTMADRDFGMRQKLPVPGCLFFNAAPPTPLENLYAPKGRKMISNGISALFKM